LRQWFFADGFPLWPHSLRNVAAAARLNKTPFVSGFSWFS
jgi:hypothetical protein